MSIPCIYTVGHSNHPIERFLDLLGAHGITAVADVRSSPFSRWNPQYNRENLEASLRGAGVAYVFLGRELGARSQDPACHDEQGRVVYARLARTGLFRQGLERLREGMQEHRIALMCAEKEPLDCHRTLLVSRELAREGIAVQHILEDGALESHEQALDRLAERLGIPQEDLFRSPEERREEACRVQEGRIAYADPRRKRG